MPLSMAFRIVLIVKALKMKYLADYGKRKHRFKA